MKTLIIDGNNLVHRTFWTAKAQSKRTGVDDPVQTANFHIYFTLNAIYSYINRFKPTKTIVVWDEKIEYQQNIRKEELAEYKGNRSKDNSPHEQNEVIKAMLKNLGISSIFPREREADDIVAYICKTFEGKKVIVSVDRDFLQLVNINTILFDPIRKREFVLETFEQDTDYTKTEWLRAKCLLGDKSDNVPGVPRFGKAKVRKWLNGEFTLTTEQEEIFNRNMTIFNLDEVMSHDSERTYYQSQLDVSIEVDWSSFVLECEARDFKNILNKREQWYSLFFLSNKLQYLLG
tara:strand:+ start:1845 stop:2714 length:870 start_codon:yes stop_codon:yes gene_type:complete